jgi:uncharacterized protein (TIGR02757 family)
MKEKEISVYRSFFDYLYNFYNHSSYINSDPLEYFYLSEGNKEYSSFIASIFSYGRVEQIKKFLLSLFNFYGEYPVNKNFNTNLYYRFQTTKDIEIFIKFLSLLYSRYGSVENTFISLSEDLEDALIKFIYLAHDFGNKNDAGKGYFFLFPNPKKSASKRMRMFLRWMIRKDEIDPGVWNFFETKYLYYPLDTHIIRFSFNNNIIKSKTNSYSNMQKTTNFFKQINEEDPVKYDFAISRLGMLLFCQYKKIKECRNCIHYERCIF